MQNSNKSYENQSNTSSKLKQNHPKPILNKVKHRLLILSPAVEAGLEREACKSDFESLEDKSIGKGGFGSVWKVRHKITKKVYAIKVINKENIIKQNMVSQTNREIEIMYKLDHPHIIKLYSHFEDDEDFCLIMQYASRGQVYNLIRRLKRLDQKTSAQYMREIISALKYLHTRTPPIIHRDIKPENILLDSEGRCKLADFGWSNFDENNKIRETYCGTPEYLAPEMVTKGGHNESVDIWSLGVLLFEFLTGRTPFDFRGDRSLLYNSIKKVKITWTDDFPPLAKDLVSRILKLNPKDRLSLDQMLKHQWFKSIPQIKPVLQPITFSQCQKLESHLIQTIPVKNDFKENDNKVNGINNNNNINNINNIINNNINNKNINNNIISNNNENKRYNNVNANDSSKNETNNTTNNAYNKNNINNSSNKLDNNSQIEYNKNNISSSGMTDMVISIEGSSQYSINNTGNNESKSDKNNNASLNYSLISSQIIASHENQLRVDKVEYNKEMKELQELREENAAKANQIRELRGRVEALSGEISSLRVKASENEGLCKEIEEKNERVNKIDGERKLLKIENEYNKKEISNLKQKLEQMTSKYNDINSKYQTQDHEYKTYKQTKEEEIEYYQEKIKKLEEDYLNKINNNSNENTLDQTNRSSVHPNAFSSEKLLTLTNRNLTEILELIKSKFPIIEKKFLERENAEINERKKMSEIVDEKIKALVDDVRKAKISVGNEELTMLKKQYEEIKAKNEKLEKKIEEFDEIRKENLKLKEKGKEMECKLKEVDEQFKILEESRSTAESKYSNNQELCLIQEEKIKSLKDAKNIYKNAFLEAETLFDANVKNKKLRDMINFNENFIDPE